MALPSQKDEIPDIHFMPYTVRGMHNMSIFVDLHWTCTSTARLINLLYTLQEHNISSLQYHSALGCSICSVKVHDLVETELNSKIILQEIYVLLYCDSAILWWVWVLGVCLLWPLLPCRCKLTAIVEP